MLPNRYLMSSSDSQNIILYFLAGAAAFYLFSHTTCSQRPPVKVYMHNLGSDDERFIGDAGPADELKAGEEITLGPVSTPMALKRSGLGGGPLVGSQASKFGGAPLPGRRIYNSIDGPGADVSQHRPQFSAWAPKTAAPKAVATKSMAKTVATKSVATKASAVAPKAAAPKAALKSGPEDPFISTRNGDVLIPRG